VKDEKEVIIKVPILQKTLQRIVVTFVDNTNFSSNSPKFQNNIQHIISKCTKLYKATSGLVEQSKSFYYA